MVVYRINLVGFMAKFNMYSLVDVSLEISDLKFICQIWENVKLHRRGGLISFLGTYRKGSLGNDDGKFIQWKIDEFVDLDFPFNVDGLVIDFTNLEYNGGEVLSSKSSNPCYEDIPILTVVIPEKKEIFANALGEDNLRCDIKAALAEMDEILKAMKPNAY